MTDISFSVLKLGRLASAVERCLGADVQSTWMFCGTEVCEYPLVALMRSDCGAAAASAVGRNCSWFGVGNTVMCGTQGEVGGVPVGVVRVVIIVLQKKARMMHFYEGSGLEVASLARQVEHPQFCRVSLCASYRLGGLFLGLPEGIPLAGNMRKINTFNHRSMWLSILLARPLHYIRKK